MVTVNLWALEAEAIEAGYDASLAFPLCSSFERLFLQVLEPVR